MRARRTDVLTCVVSTTGKPHSLRHAWWLPAPAGRPDEGWVSNNLRLWSQVDTDYWYGLFDTQDNSQRAYPPCSTNGRILLANPLQSSKRTFSWGHFLSFFAFQEGMWDTQVSALLSSPTVSARYSYTSFAEASSSWQAHRITSSAWKRSIGGSVRPRACAVLRLITNSNFLGCSTGRSAGVAPLRSLST